MSILLYIPVFIFIFGICLGSFLNCVVYRLEEGKGFTKGRSFCPKCKHKLRVWDLIPILSFIMLRGKCRYCKKKISFQYPITEISTGLIFLLIFNFQFDSGAVILSEVKDLIISADAVGFLASLGMTIIISCFLFIIFIYDLKHYIIPDKIIYPAIALALIFNFQFLISKQFSIFKFSILSAIAAAAFFFLIWLVSGGRWMGFGDVKLAFLMGLFLGSPQILVALFSAFLLGALVGLALMALGKKKMKSEVPFGPFLVAGTFLALFWGKEIITWYLSFI